MSITTTIYMSLGLPVVGSEPGPTWASDLNAALTAVDAHDHSSGSGKPLNLSNIQITQDFAVGGFNLNAIGSLRLSTQGSTLSGALDKSSVYVVGGDLYFNNGSGTAVKVTAGSGINAASIGGIGGDYASSTASLSYSSTTKTFSFTQSSGVTANLSAGPVSIFPNSAGTQSVTLKAPSGLSSAYNFTLPGTLPSSGKALLTVDSAGNVDTAYAETATVPVGTVMPYAGGAAPGGYLLCDGSSISRATYAALFAIIGAAFGTVDVTHFNLPDMRGRFARGADQGSGNDPDAASRSASAAGGNATGVGSYQADEIKSHAHNFPQSSALSASGATTVPASSSGSGGPVSSLTTGGTETRPKNVALNYIIKY